MRNSLKPVLTFLALAVLLNACSRHPKPNDPSAELRRKIVGTWSINKMVENGNESTFDDRATFIFDADGTFKAKVTPLQPKGAEFILEGIWNLTNTDLTTTLTNVSPQIKDAPIGIVEHLKILRLDEHELIQLDEHGQTGYLKRIQ